MSHYKGMISDEYTQHVTASTEHTNPVIKSSKCQGSQDTVTGGVLLGHQWLSHGTRKSEVLLELELCQAHVSTVLIKFEFFHKELTYALLTFPELAFSGITQCKAAFSQCLFLKAAHRPYTSWQSLSHHGQENLFELNYWMLNLRTTGWFSSFWY